MKITMNELRDLVGAVLSEAGKRKKPKKEEVADEPQPHDYKFAETFDFSVPLGADNLYRKQGAANWGPLTGADCCSPDYYGEGVDPSSEWSRLVEGRDYGIWESLEAVLEKFQKQKKGKGKKNLPFGFKPFEKKGGKKKAR